MINGFAIEGDAAAPRTPSMKGFLVASAALLIMLLVFALWVVNERGTSDRVRAIARASYQKRIRTGDLIAELEAAESAQRGYLLTGNRAFLVPYAPAQQALLRQLPWLQTLYADDPQQASRMRQLGGVITAKLAEMRQVIEIRDRQGAAAAIRRVSDSQGRLLMERARTIVDAIFTQEDAALARNVARSAHRNAIATATVWLLLAIAATAMVITLAVTWRGRIAHHRLELRAYDALQRLRATFASTAEAIVTLNPSGTVEDLNMAAVRLLGLTKEDLARRDIGTLIDIAPGEGPFEDRLGIVDGRVREATRHDMIVRGRGGREIPVDITLGLMPLKDGNHVVLSLRDVTDRKAAERLKDDFISTVSHELRTPLTSVVGSLGLLKGGAAGELSEPARRLIDIAENNSRRLIRLINDILDIDRVGSGRTKLQTALTDLGELAARSAADAQGLASGRGIEVTVRGGDGELPVIGDPDRLQQVIGNLLSNAIRFSPEGSAVRLTALHRDGKAVLLIDDSGPGVAPEFRSRIFSRFAQSSAGAAIPGGTGLGLAISREIIKAHDGEIWFEDAPGGGARFGIALPLHAASTETESIATPTILVCEDDADAADVLRTMIENAGYRVEICGSAREVQTRAQQGDYAGVVLDLLLPDASGLAAVRALRAFPKARTLPVIVVSAFARDNREDPAAYALDVIDWIDKPVDPNRLLRAIDIAIHRSSEGKPTLLHIDDDPDMLEVTALALSDKGRMLKATSLAAARAILAETTPDIVILDLNLPDGSGIELLPDLFAEDGAAVPTIIYSASEMVPEMARQFDAVLVKSRRSLLALSETIADILEKRRAG